MRSASILHASAQMVGIGPPSVSQASGGVVTLVPTDAHPGGSGDIVCSVCKETFTIIALTPDQRRQATRKLRGKVRRVISVILGLSIISLIIALLAEVALDGSWVVTSVAGVILSLATMSSTLFMKTPGVVVEPHKTQGSMHTAQVHD
jgi:hypothetical protein